LRLRSLYIKYYTIPALYQHLSMNEYRDWYGAEVKTGTTIMAVEYADGVVLGADTRTTMGSFVYNRVTDKLTALTDYIFCCHSGSAADTQAISDRVRYYLELYTVQMGREPTVRAAASMIQNICYSDRDKISAGMIVAGWDSKLGGQVYTVPIGGMIQRQPFSIGGSGSTFMYGHCDSEFRRGMGREDCQRFVLDAVTHAMFRDGSSGGCCRMAVITKDGVQRKTVLDNELPRFFEDHVIKH